MIINFYNKLYNGLISEDMDFIVDLLYENTTVYNIYLLCIDSKNDNSLIEIYHSMEIAKTFYDKKNLLIIGIAEGKPQAFELSGKIVFDYYQKRGSLRNFKKHFIRNMEA